MGIFDFLKNSDKTSDIMRNAIEEGVSKALENIEQAEILLNIPQGNEPQGNEPQGNEPQGNEPQGNEPSPEVQRLMREIQTLRADIQQSIIRAKGANNDNINADESLATILGLKEV